MYKTYLNEQDWEDIRKDDTWGPSLLQLLPGEEDLILKNIEREPEPIIEKAQTIELAQVPGLVRPDVLVPMWEWKGHPPVLHTTAMGWRAWEDLQIALELERQILQPHTLSIYDAIFGQPQTIKAATLHVPTEAFAALDVEITDVYAPSRLLPITFSSSNYTPPQDKYE